MHLLFEQSTIEKLVSSDFSCNSKHTIQNNGNFTLNTTKVHYATTFIQHWQLRDLICTFDRHMLIYPKRNSIYMYNTETETESCYQESLPFTPTSIHARFGYLVAGGQSGMLMIRRLSDSWSKIWSVGHSLNNSVDLFRIEGQIWMVVCNNDQTVSVWSVPNLEKVQTLILPSAINATSVSLDNQWMVMVSDEGIAYLYSIHQETGSLTRHREYKVSHYPNLSCAWHPSSHLFAITSEEGHVTIYSVDSTRQLYQFGSIESRKTKRAPRSIQFSMSALDLLAYAEHVSHVYLVDTRTFQTRQIIRLSPEHQDQAITGLTFSPDNKTIFVGLEDRIVEISIDCATRRQFGAYRLV